MIDLRKEKLIIPHTNDDQFSSLLGIFSINDVKHAYDESRGSEQRNESLMRFRFSFAWQSFTFVGIRALAVPFRLPWPICRPFRRASLFLRVRKRECTATGFLMIKPSLINFRTLCPAKM